MGKETIRTESEQGNTKSKSAESTRTETRGTGTGTGTGRRTETTEKEKGLELLDLGQNEPIPVAIPNSDEIAEEQKREERNAKRRERYAKQKAENGGTVKPRKSKKKKDDTPDNKQLNLMLATISGIVASRPNCEHWLLTDAEINSITEPLSRIIAENENLRVMSEHTDAIALLMACFTVFVPRLIISTKKAKEKKKSDTTGNRTETNVKPTGEKSKTPVVNTTDTKRTSTPVQPYGANLSFLGQPVS